MIDSGQSTPIATTSTLYTDPTTATFVAESDSTSTLIYSVSAFPVSVKAGDAGQLGTATSTGGSTLSAALSYRVASDSQKSLLVTLIIVESKTGSNVQTLSTYRVDTTGVIAPVSVEEISSLGIVFRDVIFTFN